jgi:hypothetical protein
MSEADYLVPLHQRQEIVDRFRKFSVPHGARSLFDEVARRGHADGFTWELQERFAAALGVSTRTIRRWEVLLERAGLLLRGCVSLYGNGIAGGTRRLLWPVRVCKATRRLLVPMPSVGHARRVLCERVAGARAWMLRLRLPGCGKRVENPGTASRTRMSGTPSGVLSTEEKVAEPINLSGLQRASEWARAMVAKLEAQAVGPISIPGAAI